MSQSLVCQEETRFLLEVITPWLTDLVTTCAGCEADFYNVETAVSDLINRLRPFLVARGLTTSVSCCSHDYVCPDCDASLSSWGRVPRQIETSQGGATIEIPRYRCTSCKCDYYPVLVMNGLIQKNHFTVGAKERIVKEAVEDPYAHASESLPEIGISVSAKEVDRLARQVAEWHQRETQKEVDWWRQQKERQTEAIFISTDDDLRSKMSMPPGLFNWKGWEDVECVQISVDGAMVRSPERDDKGKLKWFLEYSGMIRAVDPTLKMIRGSGEAPRLQGTPRMHADARAQGPTAVPSFQLSPQGKTPSTRQTPAKSSCQNATTFHTAGVRSLDPLFERLAAVYQQSPCSTKKAVFVSDDGQGLFNRAGQYFPNAIQILDIYHAGEHVGSGADAIWGPGSKQAIDIKERAISLLKEPGGVQRIIRFFLRSLRASRAPESAGRQGQGTQFLAPLSDPASCTGESIRGARQGLTSYMTSVACDFNLDQIDKYPARLQSEADLIRELRYLRVNRHRMRYARWEAQGLPIGSGAMESGINQVCVERLRKPGMRWTKEGADAMLNIRSAQLSDTLKVTCERKRQANRQEAARFFRHKTRSFSA